MNRRIKNKMSDSREPLDESILDQILNVVVMQTRKVAEYKLAVEQNYTVQEHACDPEFKAFCDAFHVIYLQERNNLSLLKEIIKEDYGVMFSEYEINDRVEQQIAATDAQ